MSKITAILNHRVANYARWRELFDESSEHREKFGIKVKEILVSDNDPNDVTVICDGHADRFDDFLNDPDLHTFIQDSGVIGAPKVTRLVSTESE